MSGGEINHETNHVAGEEQNRTEAGSADAGGIR